MSGSDREFQIRSYICTSTGAHLSLALSKPQLLPPVDSTPPPPYVETAPDQIAPDTSENEALSGILDGRWDLASNIHEENKFLHLDNNGKPKLVWNDTSDIAIPSANRYQQDGFDVYPNQSPIKVTNQAYTWFCDHVTDAAQLLLSRGNNLVLRNFGKQLVVFNQTVVLEDRTRPQLKPSEDQKGSLKVESKPSGIWCITGTDIFHVEGNAKDLVIQSSTFLRLWSMTTEKFRRERGGASGHSICLTDKYVVKHVGQFFLHSRQSGKEYRKFNLPYYKAFFSFDERFHFGPVVSARGLILYKTSEKALYIFYISDRVVDIRLWETDVEIKGPLVLRGSPENLELELIGKNPVWTIRHEEAYIHKTGWIQFEIWL